ncbi:MAG TPA: hypothetical protein VGP25_05425 [Gemmatimonadaceae bacterium]|nr:hypothetical protein [Gemmatimonadaceae bacterium]
MIRWSRLLRRGAAISIALGVAASSARAQSTLDAELRFAPQFVQYQVHAPADETIAELAVPVFVTIPAGSRLTFDVGTAYARARVTSGAERSEINGLTDTQIRGNLTLGGDLVVLTAGVSLPTGNSSVTLAQLDAASRIGNDFLAFPISNMGTGLAATGGIAIARPLGDWNVGIGAAARRSAAYEPFDVPGQSFRYQPGNEVRARLGVDRTVASGRLALGLTYSAFGRDEAGGSAYNTGDRVIAQGALSGLVGSNDYSIAAYNVFRAPGNYASGDRAGRENIANIFLSLGLHAGSALVEPSIELRHWLQNVYPAGTVAGASHSQSSRLATFGLRTRITAGGLSVYPSAGYTAFGRLAATDATGQPVQADISGFKAQLAVRLAP